MRPRWSPGPLSLWGTPTWPWTPYAPGLVSVQSGTIVINGLTTTGTATIGAVDVGNTLIFFLGATYSVGDTTYADYAPMLTLTDATTLTATRSGTPVKQVLVSYFVAQFYPGLIKQVQRGTIALAAATSNTATIVTVDTTRAMVFWLGQHTTGALPNVEDMRLTLTSATVVTANMNTAGTGTVSYQVVEFF